MLELVVVRSMINSQPNCKMYEKMTALWHLEKQALPLADDAWCMLCHLNALSRCWVDYGGSLVKFGFPEICALCRAFVWDVLKGFIVSTLHAGRSSASLPLNT